MAGSETQAVDIEYFRALVGREEAARLIRRDRSGPADGPLPAALDLPTFWRLCAENIQSLDDESHGVAAEPVARGSLSVLFSAAKEADSLGEALERLSATARLIRKECQVVVGRNREGVRLTVRPAGPASLRAEIYVECFAVVTHCALRWMTGRRLDPVVVRGAAALQSMSGTLLGSLNAPLIRRGGGVTIQYGKADAVAPILDQKYKVW
ncbi:MAG: AraC family transcriptional regulator ligand-binding domain-containing protein, partial [Caulobacteraceae bacterium]|nr:AraC family transcriptional regulator ligand-binding domain-containing protein [Caulobacteraceae bacterium]